MSNIMLAVASMPEALRKVKLYESTNHQQNFLDCVKSRKPTITPVETAHHSAIPGHRASSQFWRNTSSSGMRSPSRSSVTPRPASCSPVLTVRPGNWDKVFQGPQLLRSQFI